MLNGQAGRTIKSINTKWLNEAMTKHHLSMKTIMDVLGIYCNTLHQHGFITLCATPYRNSNPCSPLTHVHFQDPYFVSITFLFSILTSNHDSVFRTSYARPSLTLPVPCPVPSTLTEASVIPSRTDSSPCCARNPA